MVKEEEEEEEKGESVWWMKSKSVFKCKVKKGVYLCGSLPHHCSPTPIFAGVQRVSF